MLSQRYGKQVEEGVSKLRVEQREAVEKSSKILEASEKLAKEATEKVAYLLYFII